MDEVKRLKAALADRYKTERQIGSGGMATVYLAEDLKHHRKVAVKVLNPDLAQALGTERFLREIETAAKLTHPHILPLFDSGEADGFLFYVMPYVKGESLRIRLTKEKRLPVEDAVQITREIADALDYAHGEGVIHRDVKPANIMLEAGHAVLADFGVAQALAQADQTRLTQTGFSLGTPPYMSPEQATGERDLDGRTDQYALGCVLFEMLTGDPPFTGARAESVVRQHLTQEPPSVTEARPSVPGEVERIINQALAKSPADRFRTMGEMAAALALTTSLGRREGKRPLRPVAIGLVAAALVALTVGYFGFFRGAGSARDLVENRILVTIFENQTGDPELGLLGQMAAELIIQDLGRVEPGLLEVMPMETSRAVFQKVGSLDEWTSGGGPSCVAAAQMGVGRAISGSLYSAGDSVSVEAQMIEVSGCRVLRSFLPARASLAAPESALAAFAGRIAATAAHDANPSGGEWRFGMSEIPSIEVYREITAANEAFSNEGWTGYCEHVVRALEIDATYPDAMFKLADCYLNRPGQLQLQKGDSILKILEADRDRLSLWVSGWVEINRAWLDGDRERAYSVTRRLAERMPSAGNLYSWAFEAINTNRPQEAVDVLESLDLQRPDLHMGAWNWALLAGALHVLGEYEEELTKAHQGQEQYPEASVLAYAELRALAALGRVEEALDVAKEIRVRWGSSEYSEDPHDYLSNALRAYGHAEAAREVLESVLAEYEEITPEEMAQGTRRLGLARALYLLERNEEAKELFAELAAEDPDRVNYLGYLGVIAARLDEGDEAREIFDQLEGIERLKLEGLNRYWQACIAAQLGEKDRAVRLLRQAHSEGKPLGYWLHTDANLEPLRGFTAFEEFKRPKG